MDSITTKLKSRKLWVAFLSTTLITLLVTFDVLPEEAATEVIAAIAGIASVYFIGQGYHDGQAARDAASPGQLAAEDGADVFRPIG